jgi:hypothetical protein
MKCSKGNSPKVNKQKIPGSTDYGKDAFFNLNIENSRYLSWGHYYTAFNTYKDTDEYSIDFWCKLETMV